MESLNISKLNLCSGRSRSSQHNGVKFERREEMFETNVSIPCVVKSLNLLQILTNTVKCVMVNCKEDFRNLISQLCKACHHY